jgi:hypothetical protein
VFVAAVEASSNCACATCPTLTDRFLLLQRGYESLASSTGDSLRQHRGIEPTRGHELVLLDTAQVVAACPRLGLHCSAELCCSPPLQMRGSSSFLSHSLLLIFSVFLGSCLVPDGEDWAWARLRGIRAPAPA